MLISEKKIHNTGMKKLRFDLKCGKKAVKDTYTYIYMAGIVISRGHIDTNSINDTSIKRM